MCTSEGEVEGSASRWRTRVSVNLLHKQTSRSRSKSDARFRARKCAASSHLDSQLTPSPRRAPTFLWCKYCQTPTPTEMFKRQRASSPSPFTQATAMELPLHSLDPTSSEHGAKRRRMLAPPLDGPSRGWDMPPVPFEGEPDEDDMMDDGASKPWATMGKRGIERADEYKTVNNLLHDLHAEQQHRRLMSPSSHSSSSPSPRPFSYHGLSPSPPRQPPTGKFGSMPHPSPNLAQDIPLSEKHRQDAHASEAMNGPCGTDDVSVYDWYEEKNRSVWFPPDISHSLTTLSPRYLGSVFLERRRDLSTSVVGL